MRRALIWLSLTLALAVYIGTLVARDPGYVLIAYDGASVQTGLWVMLLMLVVTFALAYALLRLLRVLANSTTVFDGWRGARRLRRGAEMTRRGLLYFQEGDLDRAEKFLVAGAGHGGNAIVNFLTAAKAANLRGDHMARASLMAQARAQAGEQQAVWIAEAEMALTRGDFESVPGILVRAKQHPFVVRMIADAYEGSGDVESLVDLLSRLRTIDPARAERLEVSAGCAALQRCASADAAKAIYKQLNNKQSEPIVLAYAASLRRLREEDIAEKNLREAIEHHLSPRLLSAYAEMGRETLAVRMKTATGWARRHPGDAAVLACAGRIAVVGSQLEQAEQYLERSLKVRPTSIVYRALGEVSGLAGDYERSSEMLRLALSEGDGSATRESTVD